MDIGTFVQEHKRWLIGILIGLVVYWIAGAVIASIHDVDAAGAVQVGLRRSSQGAEVYDRDALQRAQEEAELLAQEKARLTAELLFLQQPKYQLAGHGDANQYLFAVGRELKQKMLEGADARDIQLGDKDIAWPVPTGVDEVRGVLFGLELLNEVTDRLFAAHDACAATAEAGRGLRAITMLKLEERRAQRSGVMRRKGEVDLADLLTQERVMFQFAGEEAVFARFLEACRQPGRTLAVESWQLQQGQRSGDPCTVKGTLLGIANKPQAESN